MASRDQKSVNFFSSMADVWLRIVAAFIVLSLYAAGVITLIVLIAHESPWQNNLILAALDGAFTFTVPPIIKYLFRPKD